MTASTFQSPSLRPPLSVVLALVFLFILIPAFFTLRAQRAREEKFNQRLSFLEASAVDIKRDNDRALTLIHDALQMTAGLGQGQAEMQRLILEVKSTSSGNAKALEDLAKRLPAPKQ